MRLLGRFGGILHLLLYSVGLSLRARSQSIVILVLSNPGLEHPQSGWIFTGRGKISRLRYYALDWFGIAGLALMLGADGEIPVAAQALGEWLGHCLGLLCGSVAHPPQVSASRPTAWTGRDGVCVCSRGNALAPLILAPSLEARADLARPLPNPAFFCFCSALGKPARCGGA